jgi:hypothetical protein
VYYFIYHGVRIFLVDTPGFDDTNRSDAEVLKDVAFWLAAAYTKETQLAGIIYLHRISDTRMGGSALRNLRMFTKLCGANNLKSVVLATTHWTNLETGVTMSESTGQARVKELIETQGFWGGMVERGSRVVKHDGTKGGALKIVSDIIDRKVRVVLDIQRQLIDQHRDLNDTDAAQALQSELIAERKRFESKLADLKQDMEFAIQEKDEHWQKQIKEEQAKYQADIEKTHEETRKLKTNLEKISKEKDEQYRKLQEEMTQQHLRYEKQVKETNDALNAAREEQRRRTEENERDKLREAARIAQLERDHQNGMAQMEARIRQESNQALIAQMKQAKQDSEQRHQEQREAAERAAEVHRERWEEQKREARAREQLLIDQRDRDQRRLEEIEREQKKSKAFLLDAVKSVCNVVAFGLSLLLRGGIPGNN